MTSKGQQGHNKFQLPDGAARRQRDSSAMRTCLLMGNCHSQGVVVQIPRATSGPANIVFLSWFQVQWAGTIWHVFILATSAASWDNLVLSCPGYNFSSLGRLGTS